LIVVINSSSCLKKLQDALDSFIIIKRSSSAVDQSESLNIEEKLDSSIQSLLDKVLDVFVVSWYSKVSHDEAFTNSIKVDLVHGIRRLVRRFLKVLESGTKKLKGN